MKFCLGKLEKPYLGNAIAVVSILGCCNEARAEYKDISEIINLLNNISWRIIANNKIVDADESNWITDKRYNKAIIKAIGQAVADCVTDKNEFANKGEGDVIAFNAEAKTYTSEHWNSVVLWNYLHVLKWDYLNNKTRSKDKIFEKVRENIRTQYPTAGVVDLDKKLDAAIRDIKEYDKALSLANEMNIFFKYYKKIKGKSVFNLFQDIGENEPGAGCWAPIGAVDLKVFWNQQGTNVLKFRNKNTEIVVDRITTYSSRQSHYEPIKIKEKGILHSIYDYNVCLTGAGQFVKINRESVRYCTDKSKNTNYVHTNTDVIGSRLHELFSDLGFTYLFFDTFQKRA